MTAKTAARTILRALAGMACVATTLSAQHSPATPILWGTMIPGPYAVGYRPEWGTDMSRTWRVTQRVGHAPVPDTAGRPVHIAVWYPTVASAQPRVRLEDYVHVPAPTHFADFATRLEQLNHDAIASMVQPTQLAPLLELPMFATHEPRPATGRFPLILVVAGLNAETPAQAVLAEFLASHGYVVAIIDWTGVNEDQFDASRTQVGIEATVRDVEVAWSLLRTRPDVDRAHFALLGHSLGGIVAVLTAMRNGNVSAAVGLDATYGFASAADALTGFYGFAPRQMTAALLDVRRAAGEQGAELDLRAEHTFIYSDRTFVTLRNIRHSEFSTYSLIADATRQPPLPPERATPGWTRAAASARYQQASRMVLAFLDAKLKNDPAGITRLAAEVAGSPGAVMQHEAAIPLPPSPTEAVALARTIGFDSTMHLLMPTPTDSSANMTLDAPAFNALGYSLLSRNRLDDAVAAFHFVVTAYPSSANAYDSYGDGLSAAGHTTEACAAFARALALAPSDTTLKESERATLVTSESQRLSTTCPRSP